LRSFEEEFDHLYRLAYRVSFRLLGDRAAAEDAAQEALARAYVRWRRVEGYAAAWVSRVATNLALDLHRQTRRAALMPAPEQAGVDAYAVQRLDLRRVISELPRRQRQVVVLRYLADLSEEDAANAMGCSVGTVKQHAHRGLERLRRLTDPSAEPV